ncbi:MAG TPA: FAD-dependent oxidoreductase, partial [Phnomibacter sp.]|nr:FAD-dependent oxidoreductase [Phnomibacter sp.]
ELEKAKQTTLRFVYFIQNELGFKHLGLADDEYPTADRLALMPYHREGRRLKGLVRLNIHHIAEPYTYDAPLYRTGISVGDYPIDHHHKKNPAAPQHLEFYAVPSYNIPLGALIPEKETGLIVAEKGISVSNVVNGTTRLQPVVMLTGQAAGILAALCVQQGKSPQQVAVRDVQSALLKQKAYIMPYYDVKPNDPHFDAMQRIGATGLLKGKGEPWQWANRTWYHPDSLVNGQEFAAGLQELTGKGQTYNGTVLTVQDAIELLFLAIRDAPATTPSQKFSDANALMAHAAGQWQPWGLEHFNGARPVTRRELSVLLNNIWDPFEKVAVDHEGRSILPGK